MANKMGGSRAILQPIQLDKSSFFCNESVQHVATNRPKGTKIIQYFACKKFIEMTPSERYQESYKRMVSAFSACSPVQCKIKKRIMMTNVRGISFVKKNHTESFLTKNMC